VSTLRLATDFSAYDPSNFFHSLRVRPRDGQSVRTFDELGTGQEQILALAFAYAYASAFGASESEGLLLVVEEPEAHLHPLAQKWLGRRIHELSELGVQVILTTHSPAFVDLEAMDGLVLVRKDGEAGATRVIQRTRPELAQFCNEHGAGGKASAATISTFYASSATDDIINGLFARACLLVEGLTESLALPVLLKGAGLDLLGEGIAVIPVGGVGSLPRWWRFFHAYEIPAFVVFDRDSGDDPDGKRRGDLLRWTSPPSKEIRQRLLSVLLLGRATP
jgi:putative ATP-dependent endonuclease of OLD family